MANRSNLKIVISAKDLASKSFRKLGGALNTLKRRVFSLKAAFTAFLGAAGIGLVAKNLLSTASAFENLGVQLEALQGSAKGGQEALAWIKEFADKTPLALEGVAAGFVRLKAFGLDPMGGAMQAIIDQTTKLGGGQVEFQGIVLAVGQAWAKQKLQGEEILQLVERGVPVWDLLEKATGKNAVQLQKLSEKGKLGRETISLLIKKMGELAAGSAQKNMRTLTGLFSRFGDQIDQAKDAIARVSGGLADFTKAGLQVAIKKLDEFRKNGSLERWGKEVGDTLISVVSQVILGTSAIVEFLRPIFETAASGVNSVIELFNALPPWMRPLGVIGAILLGRTNGTILIVTLGLIEPIINGVKRVVRTFKGELGSAFDPESVDNTKIALIQLAEDTKNPLSNIAAIALEIEAAFGRLRNKPATDDSSSDSNNSEAARVAANQQAGEQILEQSAIFADLELQAENDRLDGLFQAEQDHQERLGAMWQNFGQIQLQARDRRKSEIIRLAQLEANAQVSIANALFTITGSKNKAFLLLTKAAAISEIFVNTKVAGIRALAELGPVAGPPAVALINAAGIASAAAVAATAIGQVGSVGSSGGGGGRVGLPPSDSGSNFDPQQTNQPPVKLDVTINTLNPEAVDWDRVVESMEDALGDKIERNGGNFGNVQLEFATRGG